jgi:cob(I)alamin adenosyltransferase
VAIEHTVSGEPLVDRVELESPGPPVMPEPLVKAEPPVRAAGRTSARGYPSRMPRIYTKTGDDGTTGMLFGGRVSKGGTLAAALGAVDEAVAVLGQARALSAGGPLADDLLQLQRDLFVVGADLATNPSERGRLRPGVSLVTASMAEGLERRIDDLVAAHPLPDAFVVPGANPRSATLDLARSIVRRAERAAVELRSDGGHVSEAVLAYVNRLSDLLFVLARVEAGEAEPATRPGGTGAAGP